MVLIYNLIFFRTQETTVRFQRRCTSLQRPTLRTPLIPPSPSPSFRNCFPHGRPFRILPPKRIRWTIFLFGRSLELKLVRFILVPPRSAWPTNHRTPDQITFRGGPGSVGVSAQISVEGAGVIGVGGVTNGVGGTLGRGTHTGGSWGTIFGRFGRGVSEGWADSTSAEGGEDVALFR